MELFEALISTVTTHCTVFTSGPTHDVAEGGKSLLHPLDADGVWERVPDLLQLLVRGGARHQQPVSVAHLEDRCGHGYDEDKKKRHYPLSTAVLLTVILPIILQPAIEVYTTGMTSCNSDSNTLQKNV